MSRVGKVRVFLRSPVRMIGMVGILAVLVLLVVYLITGRGFGLWRFAHLGRAMIDGRSVAGHSRGDFTNIIFLHHSTGQNLIEQGGVRERFAEAGYDFWDHGYNPHGLRRPGGSYTGYSYNIPDDNTDPDGLAEIFGQQTYGIPWNAFSGLLQHEVIVFKSCFPVSQITSDEQLAQYKAYYLAMRDVMDQHLDRVFIVMSPPPLNPAATDSEAANRARAFADWLKSDEYLREHPNVFTFDFFDYLAEGDPTASDYNMLRAEYREGEDSHPNQTANETVGPVFVDFILDAVQRYRSIYEP